MLSYLDRRAGHLALLAAASAAVFLVNLGGPTLWDIDEGNNAEAAREMLVSGNWVVPTFNFKLREDKPALLYWLQVTAYRAFGVNEFAARLPSALAALATVLLTYELGRRTFGRRAGLLAGLVLASSGLFCAAAHFANPDALLVACSTLTLFCFWRDEARGGRGWFVLSGAAAGLGMLAKGPVGLALPGAVIGLYLLASGQLRRLLDGRLLLGLLAFLLVAGPWYGWVGAETKGQFLRGFFGTHNAGRFRAPMENHGGPFYYYAVVLAVGLAPWSAFLAPAAWHSIREWRRSADASSRAHVFLWCWAAAYLVFFSLSGTKLPNYVLPMYPAAALLVARYLVAWKEGEAKAPAWAFPAGLVALGAVGVAVAVGLLVAGGALGGPWLRGRHFPGLEWWAVLGTLPAVGAAAAWACSRAGRRGGALASVAVASLAFVGALAAGPPPVLNAHKAPRPLADVIAARQREPEVRVGCYEYAQPSLVFYCGREVSSLKSEETALEFLRYPLPVYLLTPAPVWEALRDKVTVPCEVVGRHADLYRGCEVVVVTNR